MGMRERRDQNGNLKGYHNMMFDDIADDYQMQKVILEDKVYDLSYLGVMKHLRTIKVGEEFADDIFYSSEVLSHMALDYLESARFLYQGIVADRGQDLVTYYLIPCAFLCKHSIELKLKECLLSKEIKPSFVKIIEGVTTYKYTKTPKLFQALVSFYMENR